jgi:hypothetical protein
MTDTATGPTRPQFDTNQLIISGALVGAGTVIAMAGLAVAGSHLLLATRRWVRQMEVPPSEVAKLKFAQARAAVSAGATAWRNGSSSEPASVS